MQELRSREPPNAGRLVDRGELGDDRGCRLDVAAPNCVAAASVQSDRERRQRAGNAGGRNSLGAQDVPALPVPSDATGGLRYVSPLQDVLVGDLIRDEYCDRLLQNR